MEEAKRLRHEKGRPLRGGVDRNHWLLGPLTQQESRPLFGGAWIETP